MTNNDDNTESNILDSVITNFTKKVFNLNLGANKSLVRFEITHLKGVCELILKIKVCAFSGF